MKSQNEAVKEENVESTDEQFQEYCKNQIVNLAPSQRSYLQLGRWY